MSRSTYRELLSSGRIDLIQASEVRTALANYDRRIFETEAVWRNLSPNLRVWAWSRIPYAVRERFQVACQANSGDQLFTPAEVCEFDLGGWSVEGLRQDVMDVEVRQKMLLAGNRFKTGSVVIESLRRLATELAEVLSGELSDA